MLKRINVPERDIQTTINIKDASFPSPFYSGLEYSSPARGTWNIVQTGMLIPEAFEIFACAYGCLRGVVLTAAEMNVMDRYAAITITEENVMDGGMEELMIDGVTEIIEKLDRRPRAILLYISCQHFFLAYDQDYVFDVLSRRFPDIRFVDCYMIPTLRKSGISPDQKMRAQLYRAWEKAETTDKKKINLIGSNLPLFAGAELRSWLSENGFSLTEIHDCHTFDEYMAMSEAGLNLYYEPNAHMAAEELRERIGMDSFYFSFSFDKDELLGSYKKLAETLGIPAPDLSEKIRETEAALRKAKEAAQNMEIVIDYTFTFRPLSLARLLLEHGFNVTEVFTDTFAADDEADYRKLQLSHPDLKISPTIQPEMRFIHSGSESGILALGQKAAYFRGTDHFVNIAESGGYFGFRGITEIMKLIEEAVSEKKDRRDLIQRKGFGCESCI